MLVRLDAQTAQHQHPGPVLNRTQLYLVEDGVGAVEGERDAGLFGGRVELETGHPGGQGLGSLSWLHGELQIDQVDWSVSQPVGLDLRARS
jgi:hypothetical protein